MKLNILKNFTFFLLGLIIFAGVFYFIGIDKLIFQLSRLNLFYYGLAVLFIALTIMSWVLRWKTFIKGCGYEVSNFSLLKNVMIGLAVNNITPVAKLGGEPVRAYLLKEENAIPIRKSLATIISDLTIEFFVSIAMVILSFSLITLYMNPPVWLSLVLVIFILISLLAFGGIFGIYSDKKFISRILIWFVNKIKKLKTFEKTTPRRYRDFQVTFKKSFQNKKLFSEALFYGFLMKFFDIIKFLFIFMAIGHPLGILEIVIAVGIAIMLMSVPATPGSLGIWEGGMVSVFALMGVPIEIAATAVFLERIVWFWATTAIGGLLGIHYGVKYTIKN
ncbi:MAG: flippase-like domain-containing protein [archaeon]|nr:MAG: flippase-like domain-containing protein [archaeon]